MTTEYRYNRYVTDTARERKLHKRTNAFLWKAAVFRQHPSGLGLTSSNCEKATTGVGDNDTSVAESADAGAPGGW